MWDCIKVAAAMCAAFALMLGFVLWLERPRD